MSRTVAPTTDGMPGEWWAGERLRLTWDTRSITRDWQCATCGTWHPGQLVIAYRLAQPRAHVRFACLTHTLDEIGGRELLLAEIVGAVRKEPVGPQTT